MPAKRVTYFKSTISDRPGSLLALAKDLKAKNLGLVSLKGIGQGGQAEILVVANSPEELRNAWKAAGALVEEGTAFFLTGADKTGALLTSLEALSEAGVNVVATEAVAVGGRYGAIVWVAPVDLDKTAKALGAK